MKRLKKYLFLPEGHLALYYLYRPLSIIDVKVTGIGTHIEAHH